MTNESLSSPIDPAELKPGNVYMFVRKETPELSMVAELQRRSDSPDSDFILREPDGTTSRVRTLDEFTVYPVSQETRAAVTKTLDTPPLDPGY